jgi:alanine racemase
MKSSKKYINKVSKKKKNNKNNFSKKKICKNIMPSSDTNITAVIDINALKNNIQYLKHASKTDIMPVIKANAYGHGIIDIAKILRQLHIKYIGVATAGEAILLRNNGDKGRILCWIYNIDGHDIKDALALDIDIAIFDEKSIPIIEKMVPLNKKAKITLHVDTGINRSGVPYDKAYQAAIDISKSDKFEFIGMMSHLVSSQIKNCPIVNNQLTKFRELRKKLEDINIKPPLIHIANTNGCLNYDVSDFTIARPGSGIFGIPEEKKDKYLIPILSLKTKIIQLKEVLKGEGIGYDWKYIAPKNIKVAALPIGYADILPRLSSLKLYVYVNGSKRKVLGLESMDQIIIESKKGDKINDDVYIFGNGKNCKQTVLDLAEESDTIPHEILTHIGNRVSRIYI